MENSRAAAVVPGIDPLLLREWNRVFDAPNPRTIPEGREARRAVDRCASFTHLDVFPEADPVIDLIQRVARSLVGPRAALAPFRVLDDVAELDSVRASPIAASIRARVERAARLALAETLEHDDKRFAEAALRAGADPDLSREGDRPILNERVRWGQVAQALWLLARGAGPNVPDARGWTALHQAVSRGNERMLAALLAAGGDPRKEDAEGCTPFELAIAKGRKKLIALFR